MLYQAADPAPGPDPTLQGQEPEAVEELVLNGFSKEDSVAALKHCGGDIVQAIEFSLKVSKGRISCCWADE